MTPLDKLKAAPERLNPAIEMHRRLAEAMPIDPRKLMLMQADIEAVIRAGSDEITRVRKSLTSLRENDPVASATVPEGF